MAESSAPVVLSICFRRLHLRIAAHGVWRRQVAVYIMLAMTSTAAKDVLASGSTRRRASMLGCRSPTSAVRGGDLGIPSMDGVSGFEEGAKAVFPHATVQRCIVHLIRNSIRYIPRKQWSAFTKQLKLIYGAINVKQARQEFEKFKTDWQAYPGAVSVWKNNFSHVEQLYNHGNAVCKIMYTTNAIESVNSSFRKVTKKGASFPNEDAVFKIFYLRIQELYKKWKGRHVANWAMVRNQLLMDDRMSQLMQQYDVAY